MPQPLDDPRHAKHAQPPEAPGGRRERRLGREPPKAVGAHGAQPRALGRAHGQLHGQGREQVDGEPPAEVAARDGSARGDELARRGVLVGREKVERDVGREEEVDGGLEPEPRAIGREGEALFWVVLG